MAREPAWAYPLSSMTGPKVQEALDRLGAALADRARLEARWRARFGLAEGEALRVAVGGPDQEALAAARDAVERRLGLPFPRSLEALLARWNGLEVGPAPDGGGEPSLAVVPARELVEPVLWPARGDDALFAAADLPLGDGGRPYLVGELEGAGHLALSLRAADTEAGPPVYWLESEASLVPPRRIAASLAAFVEALADAALILPAALEAAALPGWQWTRR